MIGAIIGSMHYHTRSIKFYLFVEGSHFSDDTVLTVATAASVLTNIPYIYKYRQFTLDYPNAGYGGMFKNWLKLEEGL